MIAPPGSSSKFIEGCLSAWMEVEVSGRTLIATESSIPEWSRDGIEIARVGFGGTCQTRIVNVPGMPDTFSITGEKIDVTVTISAAIPAERLAIVATALSLLGKESNSESVQDRLSRYRSMGSTLGAFRFDEAVELYSELGAVAPESFYALRDICERLKAQGFSPSIVWSEPEIREDERLQGDYWKELGQLSERFDLSVWGTGARVVLERGLPSAKISKTYQDMSELLAYLSAAEEACVVLYGCLGKPNRELARDYLMLNIPFTGPVPVSSSQEDESKAH
jgi:hypothetical protein